jgi:hypothetical protein
MMMVIVDKEESEANEIALLTRKERDWLLGKTDVSKPYEYRLRSSIRKKIQILTDIELPLLMKSDFLISCYESNSFGTGLETGPDGGVRTKEINPCSLGKAKVPGPNPGQGLLLFEKEGRNEDFDNLKTLQPLCWSYCTAATAATIATTTTRAAADTTTAKPDWC